MRYIWIIYISIYSLGVCCVFEEAARFTELEDVESIEVDQHLSLPFTSTFLNINSFISETPIPGLGVNRDSTIEINIETLVNRIENEPVFRLRFITSSFSFLDIRPDYSQSLVDAGVLSVLYAGTEKDTTDVSTTMPFSGDILSVKNMTLSTGSVFIEIQNPFVRTDGSIEIEYLTLKNPFGQSVKRTVSFDIGETVLRDTIRLSDHQLNFSDNNQTFEAKIITDLNFQGEVIANPVQNFKIGVEFNNVLPSSLEGRVSEKPIEWTESYKVDFTSFKREISAASLDIDASFKEMSLIFNLSNTYGVSVNMNFEEIYSYLDGVQTKIQPSTTGAFKSINIGARALTDDNSQEVFVFSVDNTNSIIEDVFERIPDSIVFIPSGRISLPVDGSNVIIRNTDVLRGSMNCSMPFTAFWRRFRAIRDSDYSFFVSDAYKLDSLVFFFDISNGVSVPSQVSIELFDDDSNKLLTLIEDEPVSPAIIESDGFTLPNVTTVRAVLDSTNQDIFKKSTKIRLINNFIQSAGSNPVSIRANDIFRIRSRVEVFLDEVKL